MNEASLKVCLSITSLVLAAGCASTADQPVMRELPPGTVAIAPARHAPVAYVETMSEAAARAADRPGTWAAEGAKWGVNGPARAALKNPIALPLVLLTPVTAVAGGLIGAISGAVYSAFTTQRLPYEQAAPLRDMVAVSVDERLQTAIALRVAAIANDLPSYSVVAVPASGPASFQDTPDYRPLAEQHFDSVLELRVTRAGLLVAEDFSPVPAALNLYVTVRSVRINDSHAPGTRDYFYISEYRPLADWQDEDGRVIAAELEMACDELAREIAESILVAATSQEGS